MYKVELPENDDEGPEQNDLTKRFIDVLYNLRVGSIYNELPALKDEDDEVASGVLHLRNKILDSLSKFKELKNTYATTTFQIEPILSPELSKFYGIGRIDSLLTHLFKSDEIRSEILYINQRAVMYLNQYLANEDMPCSFQLKDVYFRKGKPYVELEMVQKTKWLTREFFIGSNPIKAEIIVEVLKDTIIQTLEVPVSVSGYDLNVLKGGLYYTFRTLGPALYNFIDDRTFWHLKLVDIELMAEEEIRVIMDIPLTKETMFGFDEVFRRIYQSHTQAEIDHHISQNIQNFVLILNDHFIKERNLLRWELLDFKNDIDSGNLKLRLTILNDTLN